MLVSRSEILVYLFYGLLGGVVKVCIKFKPKWTCLHTEANVSMAQNELLSIFLEMPSIVCSIFKIY